MNSKLRDDFHSWCAEDRAFLLREVAKHYGKPLFTALQSVRFTLAYCGFEVVISRGAPSLDLSRGVVRVSELSPAVTEVLARQLGHLRLHERVLRAGRLSSAHRQEAEHYARVFLGPGWSDRRAEAWEPAHHLEAGRWLRAN